MDLVETDYSLVTSILISFSDFIGNDVFIGNLHFAHHINILKTYRIF